MTPNDNINQCETHFKYIFSYNKKKKKKIEKHDTCSKFKNKTF